MSNFHLPQGITPGEETIAVVLLAIIALLVIKSMARALGKIAAAAAAPPPAPSSSGGGRGKLLLVLAAAGAAIFGYVKLHHPATATAAKGAPAPTPTPSPTPIVTHVTQTVAPHITTFHFPLTGGDIVALWVIGAIVALGVISMLVRRSS